MRKNRRFDSASAPLRWSPTQEIAWSPTRRSRNQSESADPPLESLDPDLIGRTPAATQRTGRSTYNNLNERT